MSTDPPDSTLRELENDREALRVDINPASNVKPIEGAWFLGRLCNEQRFRLQTAWIMCRDSEPQQTLQVWADMGGLVARIVDDPEAVSQLREAIDRARTNWEGGFGSEWHSEQLVDANEEIRRYRFGCETLPINFQEVDYLAHISSYVVEIFRTLHHQLIRGFAETSHRAFELGQVADQLIHPPLNNRVFQDWREPPSASGWQGFLVSGTEDLDLGAESRRWYVQLPNQLRDPWPNTEWLRGAEHIHAMFCQCTNQQVTRLSARWTAPPPVSQMLDYFQNCIYDAEPDGTPESNDEANVSSLTKSGVRAARQLNLALNFKTRHIRTIGNPASSGLAPRLFRLLVYFLNRHPDPTPTETLRANWSLISPTRESSISAGSVHAAINQMNDGLASTVSERLNPATERRFKTSHYES